MRIYLSFLGEVELTDEREVHICERHPELRKHIDKFSEVLEDPDVVRSSRFDRKVLLFYKYFASIKAGKYLTIAVKRNTRNFILTGYLTDKIKAGEAYETNK
jgi:hypothetical protein